MYGTEMAKPRSYLRYRIHVLIFSQKIFNISEVHNYLRQKPDTHLKRNSLYAYTGS